MKVILTKSIEILGQAGEVVEVAPGYARNFLMPRGQAVVATPGALKSLEADQNARQGRLAKDLDNFRKTSKSLEALKLEFVRQVGEKGKLFGSLTTGHVSTGLKDKGFAISKRQISIPEKIKRVGEFSVKIRLHPEVEANLRVVLSAKKDSKEKKKKTNPPTS